MDFFLGTRQKAQEYWLCIPSIFNAVTGKKALFRADYSYGAPPSRGDIFNYSIFCYFKLAFIATINMTVKKANAQEANTRENIETDIDLSAMIVMGSAGS